MDIQLFLTLVAGHYLADFGLQNTHMVESKAKALIESVGFHNLTAHAFIHALIAGLLSGSFAAAVIIGVTHWIIDFGKASELLTNPKTGKKGGWYGLDIDQLLHITVILITVLIVI